MKRAHPILHALLGAAIAACCGAVTAQEAGTTAAPPMENPVAPDTTQPAAATSAQTDEAQPTPLTAEAPAYGYLDAVRAQRRALMEERGNEPERRHDAYHQEMDKQREARRDSLRERQQQQEESIRRRRYLNDPYGAYLGDLFDQRQRALEAESDARREQMMQMRGEVEKMRPDPDAVMPPPPFAPYFPYGAEVGGPWYYTY